MFTLFMFKRFTLFVCIATIIFSCAKNETTSTDSTETAAQYQYYEDYNVLIKVEPSKNSTLTKSNNDADYYDIIVTKDNAIYTETVEKYKSDLYHIERHYDADNVLIVTIVNDGTKILDMIMSDEYSDIDTKSLRKDGESYKACVKRVYHEQKEEVYENNEIICDLASPLCEVGSAYIAIVGCVKDFME